MQTPMNASDQEMSLPLGLRYGLGINDTVASSRNLAQYLASNSGVFSGAGTNVARIPISSGNFLDLKNAVVQFDFKNAANNTCSLDGSAACVIEQILINLIVFSNSILVLMAICVSNTFKKVALDV